MSCNKTGGPHRDLCGRPDPPHSCGKLRTAGRGAAGLLIISQILRISGESWDLYSPVKIQQQSVVFILSWQ